MNQYFLDRCREPSTWRGITMLLTAFGVSLSPDTINDVIAVGTGLTGLIGVISGDGSK
ncbi:MAG: hypothetical protein H7834_10205 [Magnetococcus sp. YQC-9]